jgi:hypothetical protein
MAFECITPVQLVLRDDEGIGLSGAKLWLTLSTTNTPVTVYADRNGGSNHTNPVVADADGAFPPIWVADSDRTRSRIGLSSASTPLGPWFYDADGIIQVAVPTGLDTDLSNVTATAGQGATFLNAIEANSHDIQFDPEPTGGQQQRTLETKVRESISLSDYNTLESATEVVSRAFGSFYIGGPRVYFPATGGDYARATTIDLKRTVFLEGDSGGQDAGQSSVIQFGSNVTGIRVQRYNTEGVTVEASPTTGGDNTTIRNLSLFGDGASSSAHGIHLRARAQIEHVYVLEFGGNGVHIEATAGGGGIAEGNANSTFIMHGRYILNGGWGLYIDGADANACYFAALDFSNNVTGGLYDSSFLGNPHYGHHAAVNGISYKVDSISGRSLLSGCYVESGQGAPEVVAPSLVTGGLLAEAVADEGGPGLYTSAALNAIVSGIGIGSNETVTGGVCKTILGGDPAAATIMYIQSTTVSASLAFRWKWSSLLSTADIYFDYANSGSARPIQITGPATAFTGGRASAASTGNINFLMGMWLGPASERFFGTCNGAPTGEAAKGDTWLDISAAAGGKAGYRCTTSGTIGSTAVIKQWGAIDP